MANSKEKNRTEDEPARSNPAEILTGWWEAVRIVAHALAPPPLAAIGIRPSIPQKDRLARTARGFPLVGLAIGLFGALVFAIATWLGLPPVLSAIITFAVLVFVTGAAPESGLARVAEATIAGGSSEERLRVLDEPRPGPYGIVVIVASFALRVGTVAWIASIMGTGAALAAVIASSAASRSAYPVLLHYLPPARPTGFAFRAGRPSADQVVLAVLMGVALALLFLGPVAGILALLVGAAGTIKFAWIAHRSLGGVTGAVLGAAQQGAEIGMLLAIAALV